jgi:putative hemolysin
MISSAILLEAALIVVLILVNGALAMSEMAIVSAKKIRLQQLAASGHSGAKTALDLAADPSNFLASIQIGITLIGILAGAFGGATIASEISKGLAAVIWLAPYSDAIGLGVVVMTVTSLSLIVGELVPKRIALGNAERVAAVMSRPIRLVSIVAQPAVRVLTLATEGILKLLGIKPADDQSVTEEEFRGMIDQGAEAGAFAKEEGSMMKRVLAFGDRKVGELMTQRRKMVALDIDAPFKQNIAKVMDAPHSYFPVYEGKSDHLIGIVSNKCILDCMVRKQSLEVDLRECLIEPLFVSESMPTLKILERFKQTGKHLALVVDEYGSTAGIITLTDLMEAIVGDLPAEQETDDASVIRRDDGSLLIDGMFPIYELTELLSTKDPHDDVSGDFQTLGGFVMQRLGHIPRAGEHFDWQGHRFEVLDMDGHRVDKILISPLRPA